MRLKLQKLKNALNYLNYILDKKQKRSGALVLFFTLLAAAFEMIAVSIILPLMQAMTNFEKISENMFFSQMISIFDARNSKDFIIKLGLFVGLFYLFKALYSIFLSWFRAKYSCRIQRELSVKTFNSFIAFGYDFFLQNNTSDLMRRINVDIPSIQAIIQFGFKMCTDLFTVICISIYVFYADTSMAFMVIGLGLICILLIFAINKKKIRKYGISFRDKDKKINGIMLQTFQGIKEVLVMRRQNYFSCEYEKEYNDYSDIVVGRTVLEEMPLSIIEGVCVSGMLCVVSVKAAWSSDISVFIPLMATFAVAAFRILPSLARISSYTNAVLYYSESLIATYENFKLLDRIRLEKTKDERLISLKLDKQQSNVCFSDAISLKSVKWHYLDSEKMILNGVNLKIKKGTAVGFIGKSGAGKSTLIDILLGLHVPTEGTVEIDKVSIYSIPDYWSNLIGYVPQSIYLSDATIRDNIAFGVPADKIDENRIRLCMDRSMLTEYVDDLPDGLDTVIGERGVRMSGGQRQRLAIARALYNDPQILILDEATSALDNETEQAVMSAIENLHGTITLIIVAHRLNTLKDCDYIYEIQNGKAIERENNSIV